MLESSGIHPTRAEKLVIPPATEITSQLDFTERVEIAGFIEKHRISFGDVLAEITDQAPDGQGRTHDFWRIPGAPLGIRRARLSPHITNSQHAPGVLEAVADPFDGRNFGQVVATFSPSGDDHGPTTTLVLLQAGMPLGFPRYALKQGCPLPRCVGIFRQSIIDAASLPDQAYRLLLADLQYIQERGFSIDSSKSSNLFIDRNTQRFGIINLREANPAPPTNAALILNLIKDPEYFQRYVRGDGDVKDALREIRRAVWKAAQHRNYPMDESLG